METHFIRRKVVEPYDKVFIQTFSMYIARRFVTFKQDLSKIHQLNKNQVCALVQVCVNICIVYEILAPYLWITLMMDSNPNPPRPFWSFPHSGTLFESETYLVSRILDLQDWHRNGQPFDERWLDQLYPSGKNVVVSPTTSGCFLQPP